MKAATANIVPIIVSYSAGERLIRIGILIYD
jgi:hypothetical protein